MPLPNFIKIELEPRFSAYLQGCAPPGGSASSPTSSLNSSTNACQLETLRPRTRSTLTIRDHRYLERVQHLYPGAARSVITKGQGDVADFMDAVNTYQAEHD